MGDLGSKLLWCQLSLKLEFSQGLARSLSVATPEVPVMCIPPSWCGWFRLIMHNAQVVDKINGSGYNISGLV